MYNVIKGLSERKRSDRRGNRMNYTRSDRILQNYYAIIIYFVNYFVNYFIFILLIILLIILLTYFTFNCQLYT